MFLTQWPISFFAKTGIFVFDFDFPHPWLYSCFLHVSPYFVLRRPPRFDEGFRRAVLLSRLGFKRCCKNRLATAGALHLKGLPILASLHRPGFRYLVFSPPLFLNMSIFYSCSHSILRYGVFPFYLFSFLLISIITHFALLYAYRFRSFFLIPPFFPAQRSFRFIFMPVLRGSVSLFSPPHFI